MNHKHTWIRVIIIAIISLIVIGLVCIFLTSFVDWGFAREISEKEAALRLKYVNTAQQWIGSNQFDGSHKQIIDIYNNHTPLAQNYIVQYTDKWCATFVSTVAIQCEITDWIPTECGCQRQIELFQNLGNWEENDEYVPLPGDIIYYSAKGTSSDENTGWSDHVGIVCRTLGSCIKVIEGNLNGKVSVRYIFIGDRSIRGYGLPDYTAASQPSH